MFKNCIICGAEFECGYKKERNAKALTCSDECSKKRKKEYSKKYYSHDRSRLILINARYQEANMEAHKKAMKKYYRKRKENKQKMTKDSELKQLKKELKELKAEIALLKKEKEGVKTWKKEN